MAAEGDSKKLSDLRVVDLRAELEKRGLDKTGVKANLIERLQKALIQEGKDPEEYEFDLSDKKPTKRLSPSTRSEENDTSADQSAIDSSVLMIETPSLDMGLDTAQAAVKVENEKKDDNTGAESPLNLSIGEEEENLLMNSGDEHDRSAEEIKVKIDDEKTTSSNHGTSSVNAKELDSTTKEHDEDKDDDERINADADADEETTNREGTVAGGNRSDSLKNEKSPSTTNEISSSGASAAPASTTNSTPQSEKDNQKNDKDKDKSTKSNPGRSLWVTNLLPSTRAQELKHLLSRHGKVIGAKVVQSSRYPRQRCYGYVTMETRAAADLCIEKLNNTELKGQIIRVAKVRPEHSLPMKGQKQSDPKEKDKKKRNTPEKNESESSPEKRKTFSSSDKKNVDQTKKDSKEGERESRNPSRSGSVKKNRSLSKSSSHRPDRKSDILTFDKIREERERQRQRERERAKREEEKCRREIQRAREMEKRQREEAMRLEREREKLRVERERLDRQRVEIMRLERERQRLEREKLEQEKRELRQQQMRLEEARRPVKRPSTTATATYRRDSASYTDDRKRIATDRHYDETPPPPRFDVSSRESAPEITIKKEIPKDYKSRIAYSKRSEEYPKRSGDFKREYPPTERHSGGHPSHLVHSINNATNSTKYESPSYVNRERERDIREPGRRETIIPNVPPPRISKDTRYGERSGERSPVSYRPVRDERERRPVTDHHTKSDVRSSRDHRYPETAMKEGTRYREGNSWHSSSAPTVKPFSGISGSTVSSREPWSKSDAWRPMETSSNERWGNSSSRLIMTSSSGVPNALYSGGNSGMSGIGPGLACSPPPGNSSYPMDRFDNYKSINSSRKY